MVGGKRLVLQVVQFKKTYSRNVCHINVMCWGIDKKKKLNILGTIEKKLCVWGIKKKLERVNEESHWFFSNKLSRKPDLA